MEEKALVLLSGGQDSSTSLFWAKDKFKEVKAIGFDYGQRHKHELEIASLIASNAGVPYYIAKISTLNDISQNALTNKNLNVDKEIELNSPPNTLVEGRNMLFLTYAAIYAKSNGIPNLVIGVSQTDYSNYPDCRNEFIKAANTALNLATNYEFKIHTPIMWITKAETWKLAYDLGVFELIKRNTLTCYNGIIAEGCGVCPACKLRNNGLKEFKNQYLNQKD